MEGNKALRFLVFTKSNYFKKVLTKKINRSRFGFEIVYFESLHDFDFHLSIQDVALLDDELIDPAQIAHFEEFIHLFDIAQSRILLFTDYKRTLPPIVYKDQSVIRVVAKSMKREEFSFLLRSIEHQIVNPPITSSELTEKYLETIIQIQNLLLINSTNSQNLGSILELIGVSTEACRVTLFENKYDQQGKLLMTQLDEWTNIGVASQLNNPLFNLLPYQPSFSRWEEKLSVGEHICGEISDFPNCERPLLSTQNILKLLLVPILIRGNFWGFIMLSICRDRDLWSRDEISLIKSVVTPISSFFEIKISERKQGVSDERLQKIFESSNIGLTITTKEGQLKSFNSAFCEMLGYNEKELINLNFRVFTHPDDIKRELPLLDDLLAGKISSYLLEKRYFKKEGKIIWVKLNVSVYNKEMGRADSLIAIVENITNEKDIEKALQESEDRYRKLSDLSLEGIVLHQNGISVDCNERFLEMSEYSREELIGKNLVELLADEASKVKVIEKIKNNDLLPYEAIGITKTGKEIDVELENRIVEYGEEAFRVTAFRDITKRKKSEQEIRKLNIAINQSPSSIVITNVKGEIEYVNSAFCKITGYTIEEAKGKNPKILKTENHPKQYYKDLWERISSGKTWHGVFRNQTKDGVHYWERAVISPIIDEKKNITHYLAIKENITIEKEAQEALKVSEERHRVISELTNDFVYSAILHDTNLILNWTSGSLVMLSGYNIKEVSNLSLGWYSIVHEQDLQNIVIPNLEKLSKENIIDLEYRIITKDGSLKWVLDKIKLIGTNDSNDVEVIGAIQDITQRKEANIELDQSKRYLDSIIDNLPIGLHIFDEQGDTVRINETQRKLLGVKDENVGAVKFNILSDPLSKATGSDRIYRQVFNNKRTISHEIEVDFDKANQWETREGTITLNEIIFPIVKKDGSIHSVISLSNDISERVNAERALKASEMHQKTLLKIIPDLIFVFTKDGIFKDVYAEDASRLIIPSERFLGKAFSEIFPGDNSDNFYNYLQLAIETLEMQSYNYELNVDGTMLYYETRLLVSSEDEVIAIIRDITDSIRAERALKESEEKFRELAERSQDALMLISTSNEILYVSPNLFNILAISPSQYAKNPLRAFNLIHPDDKKWVIPELNNYRKGRKASLDMQLRVITPDHKGKWIWYRESCIYNEGGKPMRYAAVITDITAIKMAEEELKIAKEEAEKANRSKSAFLANVSHEIRTPMNAVLGFSDLLYSRIHDPVLKGYLNSIKSSGNTLLNLLNDILDLSKIEAEKMSIHPSPVSIFAVFDEIKHIFSLKALEKGLDYSFEIDKRIPKSLMLDELRIKQILLNLVDNAIKFTEKGYIKVSAKHIDENKSENINDISIVVEDTGIGIPLHLQETIFESFRQQDDQDKKKFHGTGLGLAITKRLVELFNGEIKLSSTPEEGSRFEIILRKVETAHQSEHIDTNAYKQNRFETSVLKNRVILLIDEEKSNRDLIKEVFYHSKSRVIEAESVENIYPELNSKVDLIIMELSSSLILKNDLVKLDENRYLKNVPKIGITSMVDIDNSLRSQFNSILTKPIHLTELVEIVSSHFQVEISINPKPKMEEHKDEKWDKEVVSKVINLLEGDYYKQWENSLSTSSFIEIEEFAQSLKQIGLKHEIKSLQTFSDVLVMHAKNFDIDNMNDVLKSFPSLIDELKSTL